MENFHNEAQEFIGAGAAIQVEGLHQLAGVLTDLLQNPQQCATLGDHGRQLVSRYQHIAEDYMKELKQHCPLLSEAD